MKKNVIKKCDKKMLPVYIHLQGLCHFVHTLKNNNKDHEKADMDNKL